MNKTDITKPHMGQIHAECDCPTPDKCITECVAVRANKSQTTKPDFRNLEDMTYIRVALHSLEGCSHRRENKKITDAYELLKERHMEMMVEGMKS